MQPARQISILVLWCLGLLGPGCRAPLSQEERLAELAWKPVRSVWQERPSVENPDAEDGQLAEQSILTDLPDARGQEDSTAGKVGGTTSSSDWTTISLPLPGAPAEFGERRVAAVVHWNDVELTLPPAPVSPDREAHRGANSFDLPGAGARPIDLPPFDPGQPPEEWRQRVAERYTPIPEFPLSVPTDDLLPMWTLESLSAMALQQHPRLQEARARIEETRGLALQAGLPPNPTVGYQGDTIGTGGTAGYNGVLVSQTFVTANKLGLAEEVELFEVRIAEEAYRRARIDVLTDVRRQTIELLLAEMRVRFLGTMADLAAEAYQTQIEMVQIREAPPHEPLSLRAISLQLQARRLQADREAAAAWSRLATAVGQPGLPRGLVRAHLEQSLPAWETQELVTRMLSRHTDLMMAELAVSKAATDILLQDRRFVPDLDVAAVLQHDDTTPTNHLAFNLIVAVPLPVLNQNQGNLYAAEARMSQARAGRELVSQQLMARLLTAMQSYSAGNDVARTYRDEILPDQFRVYRGVADRYRVTGQPTEFSDVVVAQQILANGIDEYLTALQMQWMAVIDVAELLQVEDWRSLGVTLE